MFKLFQNLFTNRLLKSAKSQSTVRHLLLSKGCHRLVISSSMSSLNDKPMDAKKSSEKPFLKSSNDKLNYKYIVLRNGLKGLLVSDPTFVHFSSASNETISDGSDSEELSEDLTDVSSCEERDDPNEAQMAPDLLHRSDSQSKRKRSTTTDKYAAVVVVVRTGSFADPPQVQGLAHLVEHVLSMGSKEFPEENALDNYLTSRGGYQNAHTEYEYTMFEVEVHRRHLYGALNRLAHCFIHPLLRSESIERELKPVDTEFTEALPNDEVRLEQILNNAANKEHPFHCFPWGNKLSLKTIPERNGTDTQKCVKEFVNKHYYSDNIHVVVQSQEPLETLEEWVTELFGQIKPKTSNNEILDSLPSEAKIGKPFDENPNFNRLYLIEPVNETDQLYIYWCLPSVADHYKTSPLDYLGHIIGHEGKGSLISYLRKESLALELVGGLEESGFANNRYSSMFVIEVKLTDFGNKNADRVVEYVFEYLNVLQSVGPQEWFFEELHRIEKNRFNWMEEESAMNYVKKLANHVSHLPVEYALCGSKMYFEYNRELIASYLNVLTPKKACFMRLSSNVLKDMSDVTQIRREEWFGTRYAVNEVPEKWLALNSDPKGQTSTRFHFPNPNPFIATDFTIKSSNEETEALYPTQVLNRNRVKLWYKSDNKFKHPKAIIKLHLISPYFSDSVESAVCIDLFVELLVQNLSEEVYDATLAGLYWRVSQSNTGIVVTVNGFNDKLNVLLQTIVNKIVNFEVEDKMFEAVKKNLSKNYHNVCIDPYNLNKSLRLTILSPLFFNAVERRDVLDSVDKEALKGIIAKYFSHFYIEALIQGNLTKEESIDLMTRIESNLKLDTQTEPLEEPPVRTAQIPVGEDCCRVVGLSPTNKTCSITNYYQLLPANIRLQCMLSVLSSVMEEPCFNNLRTKEGLGYFVAASDYDTYGISGFGVSVNSSGNEFDCSFVDQRIESFISQMIEIIGNLKDEKFREHISSIITSKRVPDLQLNDEFNRNWNEIVSFNYCFDRLHKEIKCLEKITFDEFKEWSCNQILRANPQKRKLSVQIVGYGKKSLSECLTFDGKTLESESTEEHNNDMKDSAENSFKKFKLTFLKAKTETETKQNNFIDDIIKYKKSLDIFPVHKVVE